MQRSISHPPESVGSDDGGKGLVLRLCQLHAQGGGVLASSVALVAIWAAKITMGIHCTSHLAAFVSVWGVLWWIWQDSKRPDPSAPEKVFHTPTPIALGSHIGISQSQTRCTHPIAFSRAGGYKNCALENWASYFWRSGAFGFPYFPLFPLFSASFR